MADKEKEAPKPEAKAEVKADNKETKVDNKETKVDNKDNNKAEAKKAGKKSADAKAANAPKGNKVSVFFKGAVSNIKGKFAAAKKKKEDKKKADIRLKESHPFVDKPKKPEKHSAYVHKIVQLDKKDNQFSEKKFQEIHQISNNKEMNESLRRVGICLNKADLTKLPKKGVDKVCFILVNNYEKDADGLGVGPLNDAYLFALIHKKLGYNIAYLYNPGLAKFVLSLEYFLEHTTSALTIYYTGRDSESKVSNISHGITFDNHKEIFSSIEFGKTVGQKWNGKCRIMILHDCSCGGSIFNMHSAKSTVNGPDIEIVSYTVNKKNLKPKEKRLSQGLFTYYFCKLLRQFPNSTPQEMANMLTLSFERFKVGFIPVLSREKLNESPLYPEAGSIFGGGPAPAPVEQQAQGDKPPN
ncbi:hypothetical protein M9Y10_025267 [Tritrichomonas musculus]|uniref:Uncharacterized protein n=1 Tax=Tritrichomonas musculus TaxID=1915356 RepID=A0ABR2HA11_9EUKA